MHSQIATVTLIIVIAIIDYGAGNLTSVRLAFESIGIKTKITQDPLVIKKATRVVFPGVGAAGQSMKNLRRLGLEEIIKDVIQEAKPFLGICIGAQISLDFSEEDGGTKCLGLVKGRAERFKLYNKSYKVPHMGWNIVRQKYCHPLFSGITNNSEFYFVHSYYPVPNKAQLILGETTYGEVTFASIYSIKNLVATQFHPEKSGRMGLQLLKNFMRWNGD